MNAGMPLSVPSSQPLLPVEDLATVILDAVHAPESRRAYRRAFGDFVAWYETAGRPPLSKAVVNRYKRHLLDRGLSASTVNQHLTVVRRFVEEAADNGLIPLEAAGAIRKISGVPRQGRRTGNWLTLPEAQRLVNAPGAGNLKALRDTAMLALLVGAGLRREELVRLDVGHVQQRDGRWAIVDLVGKHRRVRTVPIPSWAKVALDRWLQAAGIDHGRVFRPILKDKKTLSGDSMTPEAVWYCVRLYAIRLGLSVAPHDLRRTYAKLAHRGGAALEQIQLSLGHASIVTTERYLGVEQDFVDAPCDRLGLRLG